MSSFPTLLALTGSMALGTFLFGVLPLLLPLSRRSLRFVELLGAGLLLGAALTVVLPEGVGTLMRSMDSGTGGGGAARRRGGGGGRAMGGGGFDAMHVGVDFTSQQQLAPLSYSAAGAAQQPPPPTWREGVQQAAQSAESAVGFCLLAGFFLMFLLEQISSQSTPPPPPLGPGAEGYYEAVDLYDHEHEVGEAADAYEHGHAHAHAHRKGLPHSDDDEYEYDEDAAPEAGAGDDSPGQAPTKKRRSFSSKAIATPDEGCDDALLLPASSSSAEGKEEAADGGSAMKMRRHEPHHHRHHHHEQQDQVLRIHKRSKSGGSGESYSSNETDSLLGHHDERAGAEDPLSATTPSRSRRSKSSARRLAGADGGTGAGAGAPAGYGGISRPPIARPMEESHNNSSSGGGGGASSYFGPIIDGRPAASASATSPSSHSHTHTHAHAHEQSFLSSRTSSNPALRSTPSQAQQQRRRQSSEHHAARPGLGTVHSPSGGAGRPTSTLRYQVSSSTLLGHSRRVPSVLLSSPLRRPSAGAGASASAGTIRPRAATKRSSSDGLFYDEHDHSTVVGGGGGGGGRSSTARTTLPAALPSGPTPMAPAACTRATTAVLPRPAPPRRQRRARPGSALRSPLRSAC